MEILEITPFDPGIEKGAMHLGAAYNRFISYLPDDAWISIKDYDVHWLQPDVPAIKLMYQYVEQYPDTGLFTCYANRTRNCSQIFTYEELVKIGAEPLFASIVCPVNTEEAFQDLKNNTSIEVLQEALTNTDNAVFWNQVANALRKTYGPTLEVMEITHELSGYHMLFPKSVWQECKFREDLNMLHVDNEFSWGVHKLRKPVRLMKAVLADHYYRRHKLMTDTSHLGYNKKPHE